MPLTLYGYILRDLLKLLALSTGTLVVVMAMGFVIKPISEGSLDAWSLAKLIFYVIPGMLTYALPIGAAFASTLVFFRLTTDNEITACAMSGVSYRSLLMPAAILGVAMTLGMFALNNWVIPGFWQRVAGVAQQDVAKWFVQELNDRGVVKLSGYMVYADEAYVDDLSDADRAAGVYQRVVLEGAAVGKLDGDTGRLGTAYTGQLAVANLYKQGPKTVAMVKLVNASVEHPESGVLFTEQERMLPPKIVPTPLLDKPRFMTLQQLQDTASNPDLHPKIEDKATQLRMVLTQREVVDAMVGALTSGPTQTLTLTSAERNEYTIKSPTVYREHDRVELVGTEDEPVTVRVGQGAAFEQRFEARSAKVSVELESFSDSLHLTMRLRDVTVKNPGEPADSNVNGITLTNLHLADQHAVGVLAEDGSIALLEIATQSQSEAVHKAGDKLADEINKLRTEITIAVNERAAMAVNILGVMLLGCVMSMLLRHQAPLVIFFWCFLPAIVSLFMINGGKNMAQGLSDHLGRWFESFVIWTGNLFLFGVVYGVYAKLSRH